MTVTYEGRCVVEAGVALDRLFRDEYAGLRRLAALLLDDPGSCEEVVQEAFVRLFARWGGLHDQDRALAYLRRSVVNLSRSRLRRRLVAKRHPEYGDPHAASALDGALARLESDAVVRALRTLPRRQREVLVLRYYAGLDEAGIAAALGISTGSVKAYASRGLDALRAAYQEA